MKKLIFFGILFLSLSFGRASAEMRDCRIGADPENPNLVLQEGEIEYVLSESVVVRMRGGSGKEYSCRLNAGEVLIVDKTTEKVKRVRRCGNTLLTDLYVKIRKEVSVEPAPVPVVTHPVPKDDKDNDVIVIVIEDDYEEPVYYPYPSYPYYSGYSYPVITYGWSWSSSYYRHHYHRDHHRHYHRDRDRHYRREPRQREPRSRLAPRLRSEPRPRHEPQPRHESRRSEPRQSHPPKPPMK